MLKDITIQHGDFGTVQPEIIHISVKGKSLGTGSFLGMLLRHIAVSYTHLTLPTNSRV